MAIKVAINGFGRIGRCTLRAIYEQGLQNEFDVVAINAAGDLATNSHLLKYDTTHGRFRTSVETKVKTASSSMARRSPSTRPRTRRTSTGAITASISCCSNAPAPTPRRRRPRPLLEQNAKRVLISAPGGDDVDATIVYGVNHDRPDFRSDMTVVSNASCTTNCLAPVAKVLSGQRRHQAGPDDHHPCLHQRPGHWSTCATRTCAAPAPAAAEHHPDQDRRSQAAVGLVLPALKGRVDGFALRVPTMNVSLVDLTFTAERQRPPGTKSTQLMKDAANGPLKGVLDGQQRAAGVVRLQPRPRRFVHLRRDADPRHSGRRR